MDYNTKYIMCKSHNKNLMPIYCEDCECPVCMKCITTSHVQHKMCEATVYVEKQKGELMAALHGESSLIEKVKNEMVCKSKALKGRKIKLIDEINSREEAIIEEVRGIGKHLRNTVSDVFSECEERIRESKNEIEKLEIPEFDPKTESNCIKILHCHSELRRLEKEIKIIDAANVTFEAAQILNQRQVEEVFGKVVVLQRDLYLSSDEDRQIERKSPFHDKIGSKILFCKRKIKDQENRIISFQFKPTFGVYNFLREILFSGRQMFMHVGEKLYTVTCDNCLNEVLKNVDGCVGLSSGHGFLCTRRYGLELSVYFLNGKCMSLFSVQKQEKILAVEENEKLGISLLTEKYILFPNYKCYKFNLLIYRVTENGQSHAISHQEGWESSNSQVAKLYVLKDTKSQIAIICKTKLQVYDQHLSTLFTYEGNKQKNSNSSFSAAYACLDLDDNILVADKSDSSIHMLDIGGQFLRIVVWPEDGLLNITSLSVDKQGWLWCLHVHSGVNPKGSFLHLFDYDYLKTTDRTNRAMTETEENFD